MNSVEIENKLSNALKKFHSTPFLFIGSGMSRRYINSPNFKGLLEFLINKVDDSEYAFQNYENNIKSESNHEDISSLYPKIATLIEKEYRRNKIEDIFDNDIRSKYEKYIKKGISPLKIEVSNFFKTFEEINENYSQEIDLLRSCSEVNISGIITTNYDLFLEKIFSNFEVYVGQEELLFSNLAEMGEIYKIHGSCDNPESIIITENDYDIYNKRNAYLSAKLLTIFLEHPIIFLGYSLNDSNIKKIFNDIANCLSKENLKKLKENLFFVEWNNSDNPNEYASYQIELENGRSIEMNKIYIDDFSYIYNSIKSNKNKYSTKILRKLKSQIYDLVVNNDPKNKLAVLNLDKLEYYDDIEFVAGVGIINQIGKKGYVSYSAEDIYRDIIFDTQNFDLEELINNTLPNLLKSHSYSIPIFKYINNYEKELPDFYNNNENIKWNYEAILGESSFQKSMKEPYSNYNIKDLKNYRKNNLKFIVNDITNLKEENIDKEELLKLIEFIFEEYPMILNKKNSYNKEEVPNISNFRKIIRIYDYLNNKKSIS